MIPPKQATFLNEGLHMIPPYGDGHFCEVGSFASHGYITNIQG